MKSVRFSLVALAVFATAPVLAQDGVFVPGGLSGPAMGKIAFSKVTTPEDGDGYGYSVTFTEPMVTFFDDPKLPGVKAQPDTNPQRKGQVWNAPYSASKAVLDGATVHLCKLQGEWSCGSGKLDQILTQKEDKPFASGTIKDGKLVMNLTLSRETNAKMKVDKSIDKSIEGFTGVVLLKNGQRAWLTQLPQYTLWAQNGSPAHAWVIDTKRLEILAPSAISDAKGKFAATIKE